ncbi:MAG: HAD-IIB family hydrolase [Pleurocapsa sp.]
MNQARLKAIDNYNWQNIKLIASDMDGTLTKAEQFDSTLLETLVKLSNAKIDVLITTGRSAGWVQAIATYLPVVGAMAENGGLLYWQGSIIPQFTSEVDIDEHRRQLSRVFELLQSKFPHLKESPDNPFRLTDWTFDVEGLSVDELKKIEKICNLEGYGFTYSTIQCHIKLLHQDKAFGLNKIIPQYFSHLNPEQILTIGDSPNDESMFDDKQFPLSVGVANINKYGDRLKYLPAFITNKFEGAGFSELAELIIRDR